MYFSNRRITACTLLLCCILGKDCTAFTPADVASRKSLSIRAFQDPGEDDFSSFIDQNRRKLWIQGVTRTLSVGVLTAALFSWTRPVWAGTRSRTDGYSVQKSEEAWKKQLSEMQYFVLRQGGTERPGYSILVKEKRSGVYKCAGCGAELFASGDKFASGTGWPSFARGLMGVETEIVDPITAKLSGAELRCKTCGGHLGDVFQDGFLFVGTEAFKTGKRYCIDGAALVFESEDGSFLRGDIAAEQKEPDWMNSPKIASRSREDP
ncbi:peptide-methionine (R)-S-oxide reductase [Fistulifera solaris]|uniref:Peptide-methionine (R)-S-oxide reductase n=1 Tax=Fistulifera solaris TaxID=1519565 RepID=A0A1Z5KLH3_FISSO|nr:peptide-methionine (R)-S-oxide reductase [Fistulifera solaris]|eukprot:GAX26912.1 peptide-methionine (R)-S-oxide reductase [Fistulifera solaris]